VSDAAAPGPAGAPPAGRTALVRVAPAALPLEDTAALVGTYRWIEAALHATLGAWVRHVPLPAVQVHLDAQSMRHAWHADLWAERLPVLRDAVPDALTRPSPAAAALLAGLDGADGPHDDRAADGRPDDRAADGPHDDRADDGPPGALPLLAGLYRVALPRLIATYSRHLEVVSPVADAPLRRALRLVLADEVEDLLAGERLVERLMARPHDVDAVHAFTRRLEAVVVAADGGPGLVPLPGGDPGR
jgi:hypothetical protein